MLGRGTRRQRRGGGGRETDILQRSTASSRTTSNTSGASKPEHAQDVLLLPGHADHRVTAETVLHSLPCRIDYSGPAPVDTYFLPHPADAVATMAATFRGNQLMGCTVQLPDDMERPSHYRCRSLSGCSGGV